MKKKTIYIYKGLFYDEKSIFNYANKKIAGVVGKHEDGKMFDVFHVKGFMLEA